MPGKPMCRSEGLFQMTGHCFHERLTRLAAGLFHPAGTHGSGTLPFQPKPRQAHLPHRAESGSDWIVTSGYRGNRIFYRGAMLACNNTKWRQIEFEYPASEKRLFDSFVTRTSYALRAYKEAGC